MITVLVAVTLDMGDEGCGRAAQMVADALKHVPSGYKLAQDIRSFPWSQEDIAVMLSRHALNEGYALRDG